MVLTGTSVLEIYEHRHCSRFLLLTGSELNIRFLMCCEVGAAVVDVEIKRNLGKGAEHFPLLPWHQVASNNHRHI